MKRSLLISIIILVFVTILPVQAGTSIPPLGRESPQVITFPQGDEQVVRIVTNQPFQPYRVVQTADGIFVVLTTKAGCGPAQETTLQIGDWDITGPAILNGWTNAPGQDQGMWKVMIPDGQTFKFTRTGGSLWRFPVGCSSNEVQGNYDANPLSGQSWKQLNDRGITL